MARTRHYFCQDCRLHFAVYRLRRGKRFCPECGDMIEVVPWNKQKCSIKQKPEKRWTLGEERRLLSLMTQDLRYKEIAAHLERPIKSVERKIERWLTWAPRHVPGVETPKQWRKLK